MIYYLAGLLTVALLPSLYSVCYLFPGLLLLLHPVLRTRTLLYCVGVLVATLYGSWQLHHRLPLALDGTDVHLSGTVQDLPLHSDHRVRFEISVDQVLADEPALRRLRRVQLSLYQPEQIIKAGQYLDLEVRLRSPRGLMNPHASDRELYYLQNNLDATGYVRQLYHQQSGKGWTLAGFRQNLSDKLHHQFSGTGSGWLLQAIVLGSRLDMQDEHWEVLRRTGTAHLLVVSGLHIGVAAGAGLLLGKLLIGGVLLCGFAPVWLRRIPLLLALLLAVSYALISGFGLPVQRALIMVTVFLMAEWSLKQVSGWTRWRWALIAILTCQPLALLQPGAWLSFCAVAVLLWLAQTSKRPGASAWRLAGQAQWSIFVGMLPLMALLFNQFGVLAPVVNLIAVPLFSLLITLLPVLIPAALAGSESVIWAVSQFLDLFWSGLQWSAAIPGVYMLLARPEPIIVLIASLACFWLLMPIPLHWRWVSVLVLLPLLMPRASQISSGDFKAVVFDVGQGLAVLVETRQHRLLYDTGPGFAGGGSALPFTIAPMLQAGNVHQLDHLVISHGDSDHVGGYPALKQMLSIGRKEGGDDNLISRGFQSCHERQAWEYDSVHFRYLTPPPRPEWSRNEQSCVLEVRSGTCSLFLPGDAGLPAEFGLVRTGLLQPVTWLVAGHHGSRSSSSQVLIEHLQPEHVIYAAGYNNRFGHPHEEVTTRFERAGVKAMNTATDGAIVLSASNGKCNTESWREQRRRYWHHPVIRDL
ncbi:DNA internalization-related competence protein ComEC/Rec2 [Nitrincola sp. MINF-07-Sa-05]|uniref:DNA internalization-related competence protein ComEC/Rec2 n=1 Tax=Nitrincola salilacus TaxID=3400273 RepID=UPI003918339D